MKSTFFRVRNTIHESTTLKPEHIYKIDLFLGQKYHSRIQRFKTGTRLYLDP